MLHQTIAENFRMYQIINTENTGHVDKINKLLQIFKGCFQIWIRLSVKSELVKWYSLITQQTNGSVEFATNQ